MDYIKIKNSFSPKSNMNKKEIHRDKIFVIYIFICMKDT